MSTKKEQAPAPKKPLRVIALQTGFYGKGKDGALRHKGKEFIIADASELAKWMEPVGKAAPKEEVLETKPAESETGKSTGDQDVI